MSISKEVVLRLTKECLPKIVETQYAVEEDDDDCGKIAYSEDAVAAAASTLTAKNIRNVEQLCRLWAGKGSVYKISLQNVLIRIGNNDEPSDGKSYEFVIKHIHSPPRNKPQSIGDRRKSDSYIVEANFYRHLASSLRQQPYHLALPQPYLVVMGSGDSGDYTTSSHSDTANGDIFICMSYLDGQDWYGSSNSNSVHPVLDWLATFHASHWDCNNPSTGDLDRLVANVGLQSMGSYWHLDTRPDEHASMSQRGWEGRLKRAARAIDACLRRDSMQCLIHGDPKSANIISLRPSRRSPSSSVTLPPMSPKRVAFYDFQYCGKGCPTRDLAYFLCTSCDEEDESSLVAHYYDRLVEQLQHHNQQPSCVNRTIPTLAHLQDSLEIAYADLCRFMAGWGYWGFDVKDRVKALLDRVDGGKDLESEEAYEKAFRNEFW